MFVRVVVMTLLSIAYFIGTAVPSVTAAVLPGAAAVEDAPYRIFLPQVESMQDGDSRILEDTAATGDNFAIIPTAAGGAVYYVDCSAGRDANAGRSPATAWRTLAKANQATLAPGDQLRFKRGCSWTGPLDATWRGTAGQPIYIGAYGTGELPKIQDAYSSNIRISGTYLVIDSLHATLSAPPNLDPNCRNQPVAWKAGFSFQSGAAYSIVQNSKATKLAIGIFFSGDSHDNAAIYNTITDNNVVWELTQTGALGAMGILLQGNRQEVGHNYFANNRSICTYNGIPESNSVELFAARNSLIHHNTSFQDRVFSELGSSSSQRAENNTYAYNLHVAGDDNTAGSARFIVTRGWNHPFGPVVNTQVYHNTVYLTDRDSKGVTCGMCGTQILTLKNNILWADREPVWSDTRFVEANNLYWSSDGKPLVLFQGFTMSPGSVIANPQFADAANGKFNLTAGSPAIGKGVADVVGFIYDLLQSIVQPDTKPDMGAYQFRTAPWRQVFAIPGRIEAENYREGGEGSGYHDTTAGNSGRTYREDGVDIEIVQNDGGGYAVGWVAAGEWLAYDIVVGTTGTYRITARVSTPAANGRYWLELDGQNISGPVSIPWTGGWQNWTAASVTVPLTAGQHRLRFVAGTERFNLNYLHFAKIQ